LGLPYRQALLAQAHSRIGRGNEAVGLLDDAIRRADETGERWFEAELYRIKGQLSLTSPSANKAKAESCLERAIEIARSQDAKWWELRAATSLARMWAEQGERQRADELLTPVYGWFTEGFDTADLKDARALLEQLA
jgi:predicted ATPase